MTTLLIIGGIIIIGVSLALLVRVCREIAGRRREPNVEEEFAALDVPPPLHPNCRCELTPLNELAELLEPELAARRRIRYAQRREIAGPIFEGTIDELIDSSQE